MSGEQCEMNHASLFTGIGGFDLAAEWMGWQNIFQVEKDPFCLKILQQHFPNAARYTDVREFDGTNYQGRIDVLTGGFPCQPYSTAGKRLGKQDERHLWPEMLRIIREVSPRWIVGENVRGLINWSGELVFNEVCADLEAAGYEVTPFLLPACGVGAPHRRDRIWFIAHSDSYGYRCNDRIVETGCTEGKGEGIEEEWEWLRANTGGIGTTGDAPNTDRQGLGKFQCQSANDESECATIERNINRWQTWTQPGICGRNDGVPNRVDRIKALGNAIVPQVALQIFKAIQEYENLTRAGRLPVAGR